MWVLNCSRCLGLFPRKSRFFLPLPLSYHLEVHSPLRFDTWQQFKFCMTKTKTKKKMAQSCQICRLFNGEGCLIFVLSTHFPFQRKLYFQREPRPPSLEKYVFYLSLESASVCFHSFDLYFGQKSAPCFCLFSYFVFTRVASVRLFSYFWQEWGAGTGENFQG